MEKEALKLLIQALKERKPEPQLDAVNPQGIPELPTLNSEQAQAAPTVQSIPQSSHESPEDKGFSLDRHGINYRSQMANLLLNNKGLGIKSDHLNGNIGFDGDFKLNAKTKLFGGDLGFDASRNNGNNKYYLQYQRQF